MQLYPKNVLEKLGFEQVREAALKAAQSLRSHEMLEKLFPSNSADRVKVLLAQTSEMMQILRDPDPFPLGEVPEVRDHLINARIEGSVIPLYAFVDILSLSTTARFTKKFLKEREESKPELNKIAGELIPLKELEQHIRGKVTENGELRDDASPELRSIRRRLNSKRNELRSTINRVMRQAVKDGMSSDEGATIRNGRMVIPVQAEYKRQIQGFIHDVSATGQTVYLEPVEALNLNNEIRQIEAEEHQEIERILWELTRHVRTQAPFILQNAEFLAELDVVQAKAKVSISIDGEIPITSTDGFLKLKKAINPNLALKNLPLKPADRLDIIPLFFVMNPDEQCLMITGPNAGGKSVAMKTVGICALMNQSGFAIPVDATSELPVFAGVFVDLGDDQSIENDLSTFSSRLQWMRETQHRLLPNSLILIDEAAAGTDPDEGSALFQAFIEYVLGYNPKVLVTTHHGALKVFAHEHPQAVNGSMEFDQAHLSPTYRFKKGIPGSSYAFEIAERMKLDDRLLGRSRELLGEAKNKMEGLIAELEAKTQNAEEMKAKYKALEEKARVNENRFKQKLESLNKQQDKIREKALAEAKSIMDSANQKVEKAVEQIKSKNANKLQVRNIRKNIESEKKKISGRLEEVKERREEDIHKSSKPPKVGDHVSFLDGNTTGELVEVKGKNAVVQADGLRLRTKYRNLVKVQAPKKREQKMARTISIDSDSMLRENVPPTLDVRGKRTEEALTEMTHYLDRAVFRGMNQVEIIHGKGNGILKDQLHKYLGDRHDVKSYSLANEDFGGAGCTVVILN